MSSTLTLYTNVPGATVRLWSEALKPDWAASSADGHSSDGAFDERKCDEAGHTSFMFVPAGPCTAYFTALGYQPTQQDFTMPDDGAKPITLTRQPLSRLRVVGRFFHDDAGKRIIVGADSFQAYDRYLRGEDLRPVFSQLQAFGFNAIRVFGMDQAIPEQLGRPIFKPQDFGDRYYTDLPAFCDLAAEYGLYVYFVVFADTGRIMPNQTEQRTHFVRVVEALTHRPNTLGSLGNELRQHENFVDKTQIPRPQGIVFSSGSEGMDVATSPPWWDFDEFHPRRDRPNAIKDCCVVDHPNYVKGLPVLIDEPDRFGSRGNPDADYAGLQAGACRESAMGMVFHSSNGLYALPLDDVTARCAEAFLAAFKGVV